MSGAIEMLVEAHLTEVLNTGSAVKDMFLKNARPAGGSAARIHHDTRSKYDFPASRGSERGSEPIHEFQFSDDMSIFFPRKSERDSFIGMHGQTNLVEG